MAPPVRVKEKHDVIKLIAHTKIKIDVPCSAAFTSFGVSPTCTALDTSNPSFSMHLCRAICTSSPLSVRSDPKPPMFGLVNRCSTPSAFILIHAIRSKLPVTKPTTTSSRAARAVRSSCTPGRISSPVAANPATAAAYAYASMASVHSDIFAQTTSWGTPWCLRTASTTN